MGTTTVRVAIVEDHPLYRQGLAQVVERSTDLGLVASVGSLEEIEDLGLEGIDVVILDLHLPDSEGPEAVIRARAKHGAILVVSASDNRKEVVDAIAAGASGYLTKSSEETEILKAIVTIAAGGTYVSPILAGFLLRNARDQDRTNNFALTTRELEILSLLADGETDTDIAAKLFISVSTVRSHLDRIRDKTGHRRRAELARLAFEHGPEAAQ